MKINRMIQQLTEISRQLNDEFHLGDDYDEGVLYDFDQTWGSTALGFDGIGGSAMTTKRTYVFIPESRNVAYVFFGSEFAYTANMNDAFLKDLAQHDMAAVRESEKYKAYGI